MTKTYLTGISYGTRDTESLKTFTDCCSCICCSSSTLLDCDCCTYDVCPASILEADRLNALNLIVYIEAGVLGNLLSFFDRSDTLAVQNLIDFINSSFI